MGNSTCPVIVHGMRLPENTRGITNLGKTKRKVYEAKPRTSKTMHLGIVPRVVKKQHESRLFRLLEISDERSAQHHDSNSSLADRTHRRFFCNVFPVPRR